MEKNKLGILMLIGSEAIFFVLLLIAYVSFRGARLGGPTAVTSLDPLTTGIFSLFLFSSSFTIWQAGKSLGQGQRTAFQAWLLATILLGLVFLAGQIYEWRSLFAQGATINTNLFGTTFFTLTGFHGLHVLAGVVALSILLALGRFGVDLQTVHPAAVESISLYWHFVDVVWAVIFGVVYVTLL